MTTTKAEARAIRRDGRREEIVNAAAAMFAEKGFRDATIQDIAKELDMTGAAIYYYFDSKDQLLFEIWKRAGRQLQDGVDAVRSGPGTAVEKLRLAFRRHLEVIITDRSIFEVLIHQRSRLPVFGRDDLVEDERKYTESVIELLSEIPADELRINEPRILAMGLIAMLNGVIRWYSPEQRMSLEEIADLYFEMFASGAVGGAR
ncbi:TetR/AcrR family transcriptional regulator [Georgenia yuyongxinii]|uniref:TetR/AcrR family transcriptional regulator n=1 Tax=Georgenia yuyongxinii TaxID=2589797 RepID=A0A552WTI8_9MICO|nr:TetR/AcrR family transcriptional regulator [Georgenia yuyongxinii]TRW45889.1 TetR/AcrR family transcriptional regulator [Georgenia yuyongxinii]